MKDKGETNQDGEEEDSPEFSGPLPSPPMHRVGTSTSGDSQDTSPVDTPGFEARNVYDVTGYPNQQQPRPSFFPSNTSSFTPYPTNYTNSTPTFSSLPSSNESRVGDYYQVAPGGRHLYHPQQDVGSFSNGTYSPSTAISPWPTKEINRSQHQPSKIYHQSLAMGPDGRPIHEVRGVLADYEIVPSNGGNQRPVGEYSYGITREEGEGFSPGSSNDEPASHHDYSSMSSTNSRMYEQSRSLPAYPFSSDLIQQGGPRTFDPSNEQPHHQNQQQQSSLNTQQHQPFVGATRRSSCPTGILPTFDTLGLTASANPSWSMSLATPSNYVNTPTHLVRNPNAPFGTSNIFFPNNQNPPNSSSSYLNPNTMNDQIQSGNSLASFTYPNTIPPTLVRRGSNSSNLGTIAETIFPTAAAAASGKIVDEEESEINLTESEHQQSQVNSSAGLADRHPQIARKARSQHNLRNPYPQEKRSPGSHERRALATEI